MRNDSAVAKIANRFGIDPALICAIITVESSWQPYSVRYERDYPYLVKPWHFGKLYGITEETETIFQQCSWGLMQVMGGTARELGFVMPLQALCDGALGIEYGTRYLKRLSSKYQKRDELIAAYNAGNAKRDEGGLFVNHEYVDKVNKELRRNAGK